MVRFTLDERVRLSIELALSAATASPHQHRRQDEDARRLGLSGAEIDAARRGLSFDARIAVALALATTSDGPQCDVLRDRARKVGITGDVEGEIRAFAQGLAASARSGKTTE